MPQDPKLEIPPELRNFAEQGVDRARTAVDGLFTAAHKAMNDTERRLDVAHGHARDLGRTTVGLAESNITAAFDFAARLARASSVEEWTRLNTEFVTSQAQRLAEQARQLGEAGVAAAKSGAETVGRQAAEAVDAASKGQMKP